jgi:uncharacterized repeat protein (TIGR02059 family)
VAAVGLAQDTGAPSLSSIAVDGSVVTMTFDRALDETSTPATSSFGVTATRANQVVTEVEVVGTQITLTLATPVQAGQSVEVSYTPTDMSPLKGDDGSAVGAFGAPAENVTGATVPRLEGLTVNGSSLVLSYNELLDAGARPQAPAFTVQVDGEDRQVVAVDVYQEEVTLALEYPVAAGEAVTLSYSVPDRRAMQDVGATKAEGFAEMSVTNHTPRSLPVLWAARASGGELVMIFSQPLDPGSTPSGQDFAVTAGTAVSVRAIAVSGVQANGSRLILKLATPVLEAESALVSYLPGASPVRNIGGDAARAITGFSVSSQSAPATRLAGLAVTGADQNTPLTMFPAFHPDTHHYALRCNEGDAITLWLSKQDDRTRLTVDGRSFSGIQPSHQITGLSEDTDVVITLNDQGKSTTYVLHCIPEHFPHVTTTEHPGASDSLITFSVSVRNTDNELVYFYGILDNNGVPRFHREQDKRVVHFRPHPDGAYPYAYLEDVGVIPRPSGYNRPQTYEAVVLDGDFNVVDRASTTPDILHTDPHDFIIKPNGDYVLLAYETAYRDLSSLTKADGTSWGSSVPVDDSIIQVVTPGNDPVPDGESVLLWNSIDHMVLDDCKQHFFPHDYAHVNSLQVLDNGDIVASFRGCSQIFLIDGETGEVIWKVGRSNSTSAEWRENLLTVTGDPFGEFCGQHAANILDNGNLVLFDNGTACQVDETTFRSQRPSRHFSRVVEYSIDADNNRAAFVRDHSYRGGYDTWSSSAGLVAPLENGNWLISWGSMRTLDNNLATPPPPGETLTEVNPDTHEEVFSLRMTSRGDMLTTRAYRLPYEAVQHESIDVTAPRITTATISTNLVELTFDEDVDESSLPGLGDFSVSLNGALVSPASAPAVDGRSVTLILQTTPEPGDTVAVTYTGDALQDTAATPNRVEGFGPVTAESATIAFTDISASTLAEEIKWLASQGVTQGCEPDLFCPDRAVTRAQMATFLARALDLPATDTDHFDDDNNSTHQANINRLAQTGIALGCSTRAYCPDQPVTRAQMAAFLYRARDLINAART